MNVEVDKELWLQCLCAWNNVPCDNEAMKKYTDENWDKRSVEGWKRVAEVMSTAQVPGSSLPKPLNEEELSDEEG